MDLKSQHLLRVEGVNLANVIDDTDQLSVRRGGGLMILNAASELPSLLAGKMIEGLSAVATGASIGLFEFEATDQEAVSLRNQVGALLREGILKYRTSEGEEKELPLKHGTFVVDVVRVDSCSNVQQADQLAIAKNRWRQLQEPTLSLNGLWDQGTEPCDLNRTRVATRKSSLNEDAIKAPVSESAIDRWHYGRGARQKFYEDELSIVAETDEPFAKILSNIKFTDDLKSLSGRSPKPGGAAETGEKIDIPDNLLDKLAVFYVDGNKFGQKGREIFQQRGVAGYREWSANLRNHHCQLLKGLISIVDADILWKNGEQIRLETLLWGGDEILWVLPAWKGWEVAKWFFDQPHRIQVQNEIYDLTYGCGLIFCHAKAPIKNVTGLAHRLGDFAKDARGTANVHCLAYEVLESYDDISGDLQVHRSRFLPSGNQIQDLVIAPSALSTQWDTLTRIASSHDFPMRQLYMLTKAWRERSDFTKHENRLKAGFIEAIKQRGKDERPITDEQARDLLDAFLQEFKDPIGWLHLLQILPYMIPKQHANTKGQS